MSNETTIEIKEGRGRKARTLVTIKGLATAEDAEREGTAWIGYYWEQGRTQVYWDYAKA